MKKSLLIIPAASAFSLLGACSTIASSTNMLSDERIRNETSGALGLQPSELTIQSRRTEGGNTFVNLVGSNKKEYTCIINGGDITTMGMTNPPQCAKKGDPISGNPLLQ